MGRGREAMALLGPFTQELHLPERHLLPTHALTGTLIRIPWKLPAKWRCQCPKVPAGSPASELPPMQA
jgi:hypothetical protein